MNGVEDDGTWVNEEADGADGWSLTPAHVVVSNHQAIRDDRPGGSIKDVTQMTGSQLGCSLR